MIFASIALLLLPLAASPQADRHLVIVNGGGSCVRVEGRDFDPAKYTDGRYVWVWSEQAPPRRLPIEHWKDPLSPEPGRLDTRIVLRPEVKPSPLAVVAAPAAMWREVPENLLPRWPVGKERRVAIPRPSGEAWRARLLGTHAGSTWVEAEPGRTSVSLVALPAEDRDLEVIARSGGGVRDAHLRVVTPARGHPGGSQVLALFSPTSGSGFNLPALPSGQPLLLVATAADYAPGVASLADANFPTRVELSPGAWIEGKLVDDQGRPLDGAGVVVEAWVRGDVPLALPLVTRAEADGHFRLGGLAKGKVLVYFATRGMAVVRQEVAVCEGGMNLGTITLRPATILSVRVLDDSGTPVPGALLNATTMAAMTDGDGRASLRGVAREEPITIEARADGFLPAKLTLSPPFASENVLRLTRAFIVRARLVTADGVPATDAQARAELGNSSTSFAAPAGNLEAPLTPGVVADLVISSLSSDELRLHVTAGQAGEVRNLGDVRLPAGAAVTGQVSSGEDGSPLPGARIWAVRAAKHGPLIAWMQHDLVEAAAAEDGAFRLTGLPAGPAVLNVETPGFARKRVDVTAKPGASTDLGQIRLQRGATLHIRLDRSPGGDAIARVDLAGKWMEADMLTAPVHDQEAVIEHVPAGAVTVSVAQGSSLLCESKVEVEEKGSVDVPCKDQGVKVHGRVLVGGVASGAGVLSFMPSSGSDYPEGIMNLSSEGGLRHQEGYTARRPQVDVTVDNDGTFAGATLASGDWRVFFTAGTAVSPTPSQAVRIPEGEEFELMLQFPGQGLTGRVVDDQGQPLAEARVRDSVDGAFAITGPDGAFALTGLRPGIHRLQAQLRNDVSDVVAVNLETGRTPDPVRLVVSASNSAVVAVQVLAPRGRGGSGGLVFLDFPDGVGQILTVDASGQAEARVPKPFPAQLRAAAYVGGSWVLGDWRPWDEARKGLELVVTDCGSVQVTSEGPAGTLQVLSQNGWDVASLLRRVGLLLTVAPGKPQVVTGLPEGNYMVGAAGAARSVNVESGRQAEVLLR